MGIINYQIKESTIFNQPKNSVMNKKPKCLKLKKTKKMKSILFSLGVLFFISIGYAQEEKPPVIVSGTMGISYEYYGLTANPSGWPGYSPRKPWNQVRFNFKPTISFGEFKLPFNFNFATKPTNFLGPYSNISALGSQTFMQFITNPLNNFSINPTYKWAELQLGTQYLNYSELTTGDIGVFGAGFDLRPKGFLIKFFAGTSQQGIDYSPIPLVPGAYKRNNWMAQIGKEKEGEYKIALTAAKGKDFFNSVTTPPPFVMPQEGFVLSLLGNVFLDKGYFLEAETAQSYFSLDNTLPPLPGSPNSFKPFFTADASSISDFAGTFAIGKKSTNFDVGFKSKYLGAGFYTTGYPFQQTDKVDLTLNTRFNALKDKNNAFKMNVVASIGQRINNLSNNTTRANLLIANINTFTQLNEHWSLNVNYNNFGFQSTGTNPFAIRNVSNDFGISPTYTWNNTKRANMLSLNYNYSKYDERDTNTNVTTTNNTHTAFLTYVPTYFTKSIAPDFSILYFLNKLPNFKTTLATFSAGVATPLYNKKIKLRGQLQYTFIKNNVNTPNNNLIASCNIDWKLTKQLTWTNYFATNYFKYGDESIPVGANYIETNYRTGLVYNFTTKK